MGLLSVLTVLGNYMYSSFIHRTRQKVQQARSLHPPQTAHPHGSFGQEGFADDGVGPVGPTTDTWERPNATGAQVPGAAEAAGEEGSTSRWHAIWRSMVERYGRRRIVVSIVTVFVLLAGTVTVIELAAGRPMADIVRNENGGGTSLFGGSASADSETGDSGEPDDSGGPGQREQNPGEQNQDEQQNQQDQSNQDQRNEQPPAEGRPRSSCRMRALKTPTSRTSSHQLRNPTPVRDRTRSRRLRNRPTTQVSKSRHRPRGLSRRTSTLRSRRRRAPLPSDAGGRRAAGGALICARRGDCGHVQLASCTVIPMSPAAVSMRENSLPTRCAVT